MTADRHLFGDQRHQPASSQVARDYGRSNEKSHSEISNTAISLLQAYHRYIFQETTL